jgi:hypothetical protein
LADAAAKLTSVGEAFAAAQMIAMSAQLPGDGHPNQTLAERDWGKAEDQAKQQNDAQGVPGDTDHYVERQGQRGGPVTDDEKSRLQVVASQPGGEIVKVLRERGGNYTVVIENEHGKIVTFMRNKTTQELDGLSKNYEWCPPWR